MLPQEFGIKGRADEKHKRPDGYIKKLAAQKIGRTMKRLVCVYCAGTVNHDHPNRNQGEHRKYDAFGFAGHLLGAGASSSRQLAKIFLNCLPRS